MVFTGQVDAPEAWYAAADVVVHASVQPEPFGLVLLEAMASECALIAAGAGGPREVVEDGTNGVLVPPGDPAALAGALERLLADEEERRRLGRRGRETVLAKHTTARMVAHFAELIGAGRGGS